MELSGTPSPTQFPVTSLAPETGQPRHSCEQIYHNDARQIYWSLALENDFQGCVFFPVAEQMSQNGWTGWLKAKTNIDSRYPRK